MPKKTKTQKRMEREAALEAAHMSNPKLPEGAYFDEDDMLRLPDGRFLADGLYRTADNGLLLYEGNFLKYGFSGTAPNTVSLGEL